MSRWAAGCRGARDSSGTSEEGFFVGNRRLTCQKEQLRSLEVPNVAIQRRGIKEAEASIKLILFTLRLAMDARTSTPAREKLAHWVDGVPFRSKGRITPQKPGLREPTSLIASLVGEVPARKLRLPLAG